MKPKNENCATSKVANIRGISGRTTAEESNRDLQTEKESQRPRIVSLTVSWCFMAAGLFVALAPMPARAADPIAVLQAQVAALQSQVNTQQGQITTLQGQVGSLQTANTTQQGQITTLQSQVGSLQTANTTQQGQITTLQGQVSTLQTNLNVTNTTFQGQIATLQINPVLALGPYVSVDPNPENGVIGPHITFKGANIHIISGMGTTNDNGNPSGLGNLIIGYDEVPNIPSLGGTALNPGDRGGSHNLIIGRGNRFKTLAFGGLVAGEVNTVSNEGTTVSGGANNTASGELAIVSGGFNNTASGPGSSVSGGFQNTASNNQASVSGGASNTASGQVAIVTGGVSNVAGGTETVVIGGSGVIDNNNVSIAPGTPVNYP